MQPTGLDLAVIGWMAPIFKAGPFWVDAVRAFADNALPNGFVFAAALYCVWQAPAGGRREAGKRVVFTVLTATLIGVCMNLALHWVIHRPPPPANPDLAALYSPVARENTNPNSFPSDSAMLYSTVAFGLAGWSAWLGRSLFLWLLLVVAPAKVIAGGHYPTDILTGMGIGLVAVLAARYVVKRAHWIEAALEISRWWVIQLIVFGFIFEVGTEFWNLRQVANALWHIRRHL